MTLKELQILQIMIIELLPFLTKLILANQNTDENVEVKIPKTIEELDQEIINSGG